jgi:hypothetical protein
MKRRSLVFWAGVLALVIMVAGLSTPGAAADAPRMSPEVLKALIGNPEVIVIDVRRGGDYTGSATKIKGAVRESEKDISWAGTYGKDKILVLYCA